MENEMLPPEVAQKILVPWIVLGLAVILVVTILGFALHKNRAGSSGTPVISAVFLDTGQVYFGRLKGDVLSDTYTLETVASSTALVPLGTGLTGSATLKLTPSHILFTEMVTPTSSIFKVMQ